MWSVAAQTCLEPVNPVRHRSRRSALALTDEFQPQLCGPDPQLARQNRHRTVIWHGPVDCDLWRALKAKEPNGASKSHSRPAGGLEADFTVCIWRET